MQLQVYELGFYYYFITTKTCPVTELCNKFLQVLFYFFSLSGKFLQDQNSSYRWELFYHFLQADKFPNICFLCPTGKFLQVHCIFIYRLLLVIATNCMTFLCHLASLVCIIDLRAVCVFAGLAINLYLCAVAAVLRCLIVFLFSLSVCCLVPGARQGHSKWTH